MTEKKKNWDDIPSLEGLSMDWDFSPENPLGKRKFVRMNQGDLVVTFEVKEVPVKVATTETHYAGSLNNISEGGLAVNLKKKLHLGQHVKVGFFLGKQKIISRAQVTHTSRLEEGYKIGLEFVGLNEEYRKFIAGVYASSILNG